MTKKRISILSLNDKYSLEASSKSSKQLEYEFIETTAYNSTVSLDNPFFVLVGEKGSGKSTILRRLMHAYPNQVINIQYKDFFDVINQRVTLRHPTNSESLMDYTNFQMEWAIELWVQIIKALYRQHKSNGTLVDTIVDTGNYLRLLDFLEKYNLLDEPVWTERFIDSLRKFKITWKPKNGDEIEIGPAKPSDAKLESLQQINESVTQAVSNILRETKLYLFVDEIDDIGLWNEVVIASLRGLLLASQSIVGVINQSSNNGKDGNSAGLRIRIAMRDDMLDSARDYVSGQKIIDKNIRSFWITESLYDLLIQPIRSHWDLPQNAISKDKLFVEIFPYFLTESQKTTIEQFCVWSKNNPRALFSLMSKIIDYSSERQQAFLHKLPAYGPMFVTPDDISKTIHKFSEDMMKWHKQSYEFMFPGLERITSGSKQDLQDLFKQGYVTRKALTDYLEEFFKKNIDVMDSIKKWIPQDRTSEADKVINRLCITGFLEEITKDDQSMFEVSPMFKPSLARQIRNNLSPIPDETIQGWVDLVLLAINDLNDSILPPKDTIIPGDVGSAKTFDPQSIRYNIVKCFWSLRYLQKMVIAYGDREEINNKLNVYEVLETIRVAEKGFSRIMETSLAQIDILSVLLNSPKGHFISVEEFANHLDAIKKVESGSDAEMYLFCATGIKNWVQNIGNSRKKNILTNELSETLKTLKAGINDSINNQVTSLETTVRK